ncbi:unnamed protein product [Effrenium voratum]|nr:unnamed protein product [Effrenium voratum]
MMSTRTGSKLPALLTPAATYSDGTGYKQARQEPAPSYNKQQKAPQAVLPQLTPASARSEAQVEEETWNNSRAEASLDQNMLDLVDPYNKGVVRYADFAWLHVRLIHYSGRPATILEKVQSLGAYPQQVFRKFDVDQDNHLDKAEWQEYASSDTLSFKHQFDSCRAPQKEAQSERLGRDAAESRANGKMHGPAQT